ncbi:MAG: hemolysin family protein [Bryobacteraceae bacterium]|nr:hemolysin family protein [Bryobacteraceae bacterium]
MLLGTIIALGLVLLGLATTVQMFYLEALRLRTRELPSLTYFKEQLEDQLGLKTERGALIFSLWKHTLLALVGVAMSVLATHEKFLGEDFLEAALFSWLSMMVVCYVLPQLIYRKTTGLWMNPLVPVFRLMILAMRPLAALLDFLHSLADLSGAAAVEEEPQSAAEEIEALIDAGAEEGLIEEGDRKMIQSVVAFGEKVIRDVMTPRPSVVGIHENASLDDLRQLVIHEQYSRIPVFREDIDSIVGFVHVHDVLEVNEAERPNKKVKDLVRPIRLVPETKSVKVLLEDMRENRQHMAAVIDEYGHTAGLVTMEDMLEELVGEIRDEHEPHQDVESLGNGEYVVAGSFDIRHLGELLEFSPDEDTEATTVGGLVTEWAGRVPAVGEAVEREGIRLEVLAANGLRVDQVKLSRLLESRPVEAKKEQGAMNGEKG